MRYADWDVLLFPTGRDSIIPFKEFRVACHVVPDVELSHINGSSMPVMTCFVPSLPAGTPFQISIHSWRIPGISQFTRSYSKHTDLVQFEARILLDGQLVATSLLGREFIEPHLITNTFELTKTGELENLKFPPFRRELLFQNHWNPADDIGRIKIIISEGFPRDSLSVPIERVKNVITFSFQHAPLEILESNGIAWPNPSMWRSGSLTASQLNNASSSSSPIPPPLVPTFHPVDGAQLHTHSPRRKSLTLRGAKGQAGFGMGTMGGGLFAQQQQAFNQQQQQPGLSAATTLFSRNNGSGLVGTGLFGYHAPEDVYSKRAYLEWVATNMANDSVVMGGAGSLWPGMIGSSLGMGQQESNSLNTRHQEATRESGNIMDCIYNVAHRHGHCGESMHMSADSLESDDPMLGSCGSSGNEGIGRIGVTTGVKVPTNTPTSSASPGNDYQHLGGQYMLGGDVGGGVSLWAQTFMNNSTPQVSFGGEIRGGENCLRNGEGCDSPSSSSSSDESIRGEDNTKRAGRGVSVGGVVGEGENGGD